MGGIRAGIAGDLSESASRFHQPTISQGNLFYDALPSLTGLIGITITLTLSADSATDLIRLAGQIVKQFLGTILYLAGPH